MITEAEEEQGFGGEGGLSAALRPVISGQLLGLEEASTDNDRLRPGRVALKGSTWPVGQDVSLQPKKVLPRWVPREPG